MDTYCLKWSEFGSSIRESFSTLRKSKQLFDITLATDDGHQIQAHKLVLFTGSKFFSDMFMNADHRNMLIYLKGINRLQLEQIIDFLYNGEATIAYELLNTFLETAKELKVNALQSYEQFTGVNYSESNFRSGGEDFATTNHDIVGNIKEEDVEHNSGNAVTPIEYGFVGQDYEQQNNDYQADEGGILNTLDELEDLIDINHTTKPTNDTNKSGVQGKVTHEIYKNTRVADDGNRNKPAVSFICHICKRSTASKVSLQLHIVSNHSNSSHNCGICGKSGMSKKEHRDHKRKNH